MSSMIFALRKPRTVPETLWRGQGGNSVKFVSAKAMSISFARALFGHIKLDSMHEAASAMSSAAGCVKKADPQKAIPFYNKSADYFCNLGRLGMAAKSYREAAEQLRLVLPRGRVLAFAERTEGLQF